MDEGHLKEYEVEVEYETVYSETHSRIVTIEAFNEDEAIEKAEEEVDNYETDCDEVNFIESKVTSETSTEPGTRDDKTIDMFEEE
jgi:hypothetical protein